MFGKGEIKATKSMPQEFPSQPAPKPAPKPLHEHAQAVAQNIIELQDEITRLTTERNDLSNTLKAEEYKNDDLVKELTHTRNQLDHYKKIAITLDTKLRTAASIIYDCLKSPVIEDKKEEKTDFGTPGQSDFNKKIYKEEVDKVNKSHDYVPPKGGFVEGM